MTSQHNSGVYKSACFQPLKKEPGINSIAGLRFKLDITVAAVIACVVLQQALIGFSRRLQCYAAGATP